MKRYFYFLFALCMGAVVMTSCKPTNAPDNGEKEFAFAAQYEIDYGTPTADDTTLIENAFRKAGVSLGEYTMVFTGDSASVRKQLEEKMAPVMESLMAVPETISVLVVVKGAEKKYVDAENDKEHPITIWYSKRVGVPENPVII